MASIKKVLILSANPRGTAHLRLDEEVREIEEGLQRSKLREQFVIHSKWATRLKDLRRAMLDYEPHLVHFCGHGDEDGLMVEDENGTPSSSHRWCLARRDDGKVRATSISLDSDDKWLVRDSRYKPVGGAYCPCGFANLHSNNPSEDYQWRFRLPEYQRGEKAIRGYGFLHMLGLGIADCGPTSRPKKVSGKLTIRDMVRGATWRLIHRTLGFTQVLERR